MAELGGGDTGSAKTATSLSGSIDHLRSIAEQHLKEIDQERAQEDKDEAKRLQDLERYTKKRRGKGETPVMSNQQPTTKMRSAQDILHRLQWDKKFDISQFRVGYLERFAGIKETPASSWITEITEEEWIPQHRIKYFKLLYEDGRSEIVWDRDNRIDKIFGSGGIDSPLNDNQSEDGGMSLLAR